MIEYKLVTDYEKAFRRIDTIWGVDKVFPDGFPIKGYSQLWDLYYYGEYIAYMCLESSDEGWYFHCSCIKHVPKAIRKVAFKHFTNHLNNRIIIKMPYRKGIERILTYYGFSDFEIQGNAIKGFYN